MMKDGAYPWVDKVTRPWQEHDDLAVPVEGFLSQMKEMSDLWKKDKQEKSRETGEAGKIASCKTKIFCAPGMESGGTAGGKETRSFVRESGLVGSFSHPEEQIHRSRKA
jgi:hypothetical protein